MKTHTHNKSRNRVWIAVTAIAAVAGTGFLGTPTWAQPDTNNIAKAENPANRKRGKGKKGEGQKVNREAAIKLMQERELEELATATGKTFTDAEKQKIRDAMAIRENATQAARQKYITDLAAATGMEADELGMKIRETRGKRAARALGGDAMQNDKRAKRAERLNRRNKGDAAPVAPQ